MLGLLLLSAIPLIAGGVRLSELAAGATITPANARFFASPLPVVLHRLVQLWPPSSLRRNENPYGSLIRLATT